MQLTPQLLLLSAVALSLRAADAQSNFLVSKCGGPRQQGWKIVNKTLGGVTASNLEDTTDGAPVGPNLNCPGSGTCHSWGGGFGDRNGVVLIKGTAASFIVESWPDTKTLPVGNGKTPPGQCLTADHPGKDGSTLHMKPAGGAACLALSWSGTTLKVVGSTDLCLGASVPPPPSPPPPPPAPPPYSGVTCKDPKFSFQPYCNRRCAPLTPTIRREKVIYLSAVTSFALVRCC